MSKNFPLVQFTAAGHCGNTFFRDAQRDNWWLADD